jgi:hypothetical protein
MRILRADILAGYACCRHGIKGHDTTGRHCRADETQEMKHNITGISNNQSLSCKA